MIDRRTMLGMLTALPVAAADGSPAADVVVSQSGRPGKVATVAAALTLAARAGRPFRIRVEAGTWTEKLDLTVPDVTITGAGPATVLTFGAAAGLPAPDGKPWGTGRTATLSLRAPGTVLERITIRNGFDYLANRASGAVPGAQAVALLVDRGADRTLVRDCAIEGYQDTLYVQARSLFERCRIAGSTDFVFGGGAAWFAQCRIVSRAVPGAEPQGYVAAPSTPASQRFGLVFADCRLEREDGVPDGSVWLGRPWRAGGNMALTGSATFLRCWMDAHVRSGGWTAMGYTGPDGTRTMLTPPQARLSEWRSTGPGAGVAGPDRRWLDDAAATGITSGAVLDRWWPAVRLP